MTDCVQDDQLPKSVCPVCLTKVEVTLQFNQQIVNSHKFFLAKFKVTDSIQPPQPPLVHDNANGGDSKDPLAPLVDGNKGMPASLLPSYLKRLTAKGGGGGSVVLGGGKKRKKKRYLLMEVEDDPSAKRQVDYIYFSLCCFKSHKCTEQMKVAYSYIKVTRYVFVCLFVPKHLIIRMCYVAS